MKKYYFILTIIVFLFIVLLVVLFNGAQKSDNYFQEHQTPVTIEK